jgi:bifunctional isochorismate lyase/aryl carrier protein
VPAAEGPRMDEGYLSSSSFLRRARDLVAGSRAAGRTLFTPGATALLAIDMDRCFTDPSSHAYVPGSGVVLKGVARLARAFSERDLAVFFTRHANTPENAGMLARWWDDLIEEGSPAAALSPDIDATLGTVVPKTQYDAFHGTGLEGTLRERGVERLVITGVVTHLCCETTARSAFVRGFEVTFPVDGTAAYDQEHHLATLLNLGHGFAALGFVEDVLEAMRGASR